MCTRSMSPMEKQHKPVVKQEDAMWTKEIYFVFADLITTKVEHKRNAELTCASYNATLTGRAAVRRVMFDQVLSFFLRFPCSPECLQFQTQVRLLVIR